MTSWLRSSKVCSKGSKISSSRSSVLMMRPVDKLGREILRLGMQISGDWTEVKKGEIFNSVRFERLKCKKLCASTDLCLDRVHYCQVELDDVTRNLEGIRTAVGTHDESVAEKMKRLVNHDYLVVELLTGDPASPKIHIRAEKIGLPDDQAGIHIGFCEDHTGEHAKNVTLCTIDCNQKKMGLEIVLEVLENQDADYSVAEHNCWEYARDTTKRLLVACKQYCKDEQERMRFQRETDELEGHLSLEHLKNNGKRLVRGLQMPLKGIFNSSSTKSVAGGKQAVQTTKAAAATVAYGVATHLDPVPLKAGGAQDEAYVVVSEAVVEVHEKN